MQEVFEKIVEKLGIRAEKSEKKEMDAEHFEYAQMYKGERIAFGDAIEIVKQAAAECKHGHFGCNSNGQHEKCYLCCDYDCKNRNREWFGAKDDNNGWIPCIERLPKYGEVVMCCCENGGITVSCITHKCVKLSKFVWFGQHRVIAWQPLPAPYQPKGE